MATLYGSGTQPPPGPNTSQASGTELHMERSARHCIIRRPKLKLLSDETLANSQSQLEYTPASNSVDFKYSVGGSAVSISTSTTNTARQTDQGVQVYGENAALCLRFLDWRIKVTISKLDSYNQTLENGINLFNSKMSSNVRKLDKKIQLIIASKNARAEVVKEFHRLRDEKDSLAYNYDKMKNMLKNSFHDTVRKIECLNVNKDNCNLMITRLIKAWKADTGGLDVPELDRPIKNLTRRKDQYDRDMNKKIKALTARQETCVCHLKMVNAKVSHANYLDKQIKLLSAQKKSMGNDLMRQVELVNAIIHSYNLDFERRIIFLKQQVTSYYHDIRRQSELVDSMKAPFVHDLDSQLKLLDAKSAIFHDFRKQQPLLISKLLSYVNEIGKKGNLLHSSIRLHLNEESQLLK